MSLFLASKPAITCRLQLEGSQKTPETACFGWRRVERQLRKEFYRMKRLQLLTQPSILPCRIVDVGSQVRWCMHSVRADRIPDALPRRVVHVGAGQHESRLVDNGGGKLSCYVCRLFYFRIGTGKLGRRKKTHESVSTASSRAKRSIEPRHRHRQYHIIAWQYLQSTGLDNFSTSIHHGDRSPTTFLCTKIGKPCRFLVPNVVTPIFPSPSPRHAGCL